MYERFDEGGKVICQVCGKSLGFVTPAHLKTHKMRFAEYKEKFKDFPLKSLPWEAKANKNNKIDLFKKIVDENEKIENIKPIKPKPIKTKNIKLKEKNTPKTKIKRTISGFQGKNNIFNLLKKSYPNLVMNYYIDKKLNTGAYEYYFITDMADPVTKIDFEFPDTFWHNNDNVFNVNRDTILKRDGWRVLVFKGASPKPKNIEKDLDIITD